MGFADGDEVVRAAGSGQPSRGQTKATRYLIEAGVWLVDEGAPKPRIALDGLGQCPQIVHVESALALVSLTGLQP